MGERSHRQLDHDAGEFVGAQAVTWLGPGLAPMPHAVSRVRTACLRDSPTRPVPDRGLPRKLRCDGCRLIPSDCMCALRPVVATRAAVCLVMAEFEALKPSNTGWLVADVVPDTVAFRWSRREVDPALLALLDDPQWRPQLVFPAEFADPGRSVTRSHPTDADSGAIPIAGEPMPAARPLFILLDGTWSEARKIFRKSPYLNRFPVLSLHPDRPSRYRLRRSTHDGHFCTAEVAALCLGLAGDLHAAQTLEAYLEVYSSRYLRARQSVAPDPHDAANRRLRALGNEPLDSAARHRS